MDPFFMVAGRVSLQQPIGDRHPWEWISDAAIHPLQQEIELQQAP